MDDVRLHDELRRYWDEVARGRPATRSDLDPELAATIRRLHALPDAPPPDPVYAKKLEERLMSATTINLPLGDPVSRPGLNGSSVPLTLASIAPQFPVAPIRRVSAQLASALLALIVLLGSVVIFGPGRPGQQDDTSLVLPALSGTPATPEVGVAETLLDAPATLPGGPATFELTHWTLRPDSPPLRVAARNSLGARREGPLFIVAESGSIVITEAGTEHRLAAGDVYAATDPDQEVAIAADGPAHAAAFVVPVLTGSALPISYDPQAHVAEFFWSLELDAVAGGAGRLVLERLTLAPGSALPWEEAAPLVWTGVRAGTLGLTLEGAQLAAGWTAGQERQIRGPGPLPSAGARPLPSLPAGTRMLLRNAGDEPLVLYRLTLTPDRAGAAVGTPVP